MGANKGRRLHLLCVLLMKIYAKLASDRAHKGQGGNKYIEIELYAFNRSEAIGTVLLTVEEDATGKPVQYLVKWKAAGVDSEWHILQEGHETEGIIQGVERGVRNVVQSAKGKRQKGERCYCSDDDMSIPHYH